MVVLLRIRLSLPPVFVRGCFDLVERSDKNLRSRGIHNDLGRTQEENDGQVLSSGEIQKLEIELWNLKSSKPKTFDETIELANDLMGQKLRTYAEKSNNKGKVDDSSKNNHGHQQQPFKKQNVAKERQGWGMRLETQKEWNASGNPDSNVITVRSILKPLMHLALFDAGTDMSFISATFSSLINIIPTLLDNSYEVELADGKNSRGRHYSAGLHFKFLKPSIQYRPNAHRSGERSRLDRIYPHDSKAQDDIEKGCSDLFGNKYLPRKRRQSERKQLFNVQSQDYPELFSVRLARSLPGLTPMEIPALQT
ncbi:hypothetical protein Tco_1418600 [Tanacetum coccineum]